MLGRDGLRRALVTAALVLGTASGAVAAEDGIWSVSKASGDVWIASDGAQQVSLKQEETLKPGETIRTGRNGRVLLVRGEERMLISPNSVVGLPAEKKDGLSTTVVQQAGSILLEVERRNVKHFEVETPYLAAVVKGTRFSVTVTGGSTKVGVLRGQVEVSDFKTGQIAQVMPGQTATAFEHGKPGLSLSGSGSFNPIEQGKPRASTIERIPVPKSGLSAPRNAANGHAFHALANVDKSIKSAGAHSGGKAGVVHISGSLGEVKLNFHKVTHGLARGSVVSGVRSASTSSTDTIWNDSKSSSTTTASNGSSQTAAGSSGSGASSTGSASSGVTVAISAGSSSDAANQTSGNGNGNSGNGNGGGNGNGNNGNGNGNGGATGNGKGNNGNGNGNGGGNGSNGNANGHAKH